MAEHFNTNSWQDYSKDPQFPHPSKISAYEENWKWYLQNGMRSSKKSVWGNWVPYIASRSFMQHSYFFPPPPTPNIAGHKGLEFWNTVDHFLLAPLQWRWWLQHCGGPGVGKNILSRLLSMQLEGANTVPEFAEETTIQNYQKCWGLPTGCLLHLHGSQEKAGDFHNRRTTQLQYTRACNRKSRFTAELQPSVWERTSHQTSHHGCCQRRKGETWTPYRCRIYSGIPPWWNQKKK